MIARSRPVGPMEDNSKRLAQIFQELEMEPQTIVDHNSLWCCPECGNPITLSMAELRDLVSKPSSQFSSDLADWLAPPQRPVRPLSKRHRTGFRNSIAFGIVWMIVFSVTCFAFSGEAPNLVLTGGALFLALVLALFNWRSESKLAEKEDSVLLGVHWERYRAYLRRRRVWSRLRYCLKCGLVLDPVTQQSRTLFELHELANSRVGLRG